MAPDMDTQALIDRIRARGPDGQAAVNDLLAEVLRRAAGWAQRWTEDDDTVDDVAEATAWKVYQHLAHFDNSRPFWPWVKAIARNCFYDGLRQNARLKPFVDEVLRGVDNQPGVAAQAERRVLLAAIERSLSPIEHQVLLALYVEGLEAAEVADRLGISRSRVYQIREQIQAKAHRLR